MIFKKRVINTCLTGLLTVVFLIIFLSACSGNDNEAGGIDYSPSEDGDIKVSTPEEQGIDRALIDRLYKKAEGVETIESLLVIKNGYIIAEKYYGEGGLIRKGRVQSVTKSVTSALTGIAIERGEIESVNVKMMDYFPELQDGIKDARKNDITLEHMLQMRAGYPWEESSPELFDMLYGGFRPSYLASVPLAYTPDEDMTYSNLTSHLIGVIVSRATGESLMDYAQEHLFGPLGIMPGEWTTDWEGYNNGHADLYLSARDMAKFGLLYLNGGEYDGRQIVSSEWVEKSLGIYSEDAWGYRIGRNVKDMSYGYQWWSARAGQRWYSFAWGHGGQQIALIDDMDMVVVVKADPLVGQHGDKPWKYEKENLNLVGDFAASLP